MTGNEQQAGIIATYPHPINTLADAIRVSEVVHAGLAVQMETAQFQAGFVEAQTGTQYRFDLSQGPTEQGLVEVVRNLCYMAADGELTDELICHDCGLLAGWLLRPVPETVR